MPVAQQFASDSGAAQIEVMRLGMGLRTASGMHRAFMFGEEDRESTGKISINVVLSGMSTCSGRKNPHILMPDEPDIALSPSSHLALGQHLADFAASLPGSTEALVIVTHAREIIRPLLALDPTCIRLGDERRTTAQWVEESDPPATIEELLSLRDKALTRRRAIAKILDDQNKKAG